MGLRTRSFLTGAAKGFLARNNANRERMNERYQALADNKYLRDTEAAKSEYEAHVKAAREEQSKLSALRSAGHVTTDDKGRIAYTDRYYQQGAMNAWMETSGKNKNVTFEQFVNDTNNQQYIDAYKGGKAKYFERQYKDPSAYKTSYREELSGLDERRQRQLGVQQFTGIDQMISQGIGAGAKAVTGAFGAEEASVGGIDLTQGGGEGTAFDLQGGAAAMGADATAQATPIASAGAPQVQQEFHEQGGPLDVPNVPGAVERKNLQSVHVDGAEGNFFLDPATNQIIGPGTGGQWIDAGDMQMIFTDEKPLTMDYTDMTTGEEMTGTLVETFANDPNAVLKRGGKTYAALSTPTKKHGKQDQHGPKSLTKAQNKDLEFRNSASNVQSLSQEMLNQDYISNPAGWVAARMSTIGSMFSSVLPDLGGGPEDIEAIVNYIKSDVADDAEASKELGILDARAIAEGNVMAINKLLSYGTALWMNGGTRITEAVKADAKDISEAWLTGTAKHRGKLASLRNQASRGYARIASRHLNSARDDSNSPVWSQYPNVKRSAARGWDFATDIAEGMQIQRQLKELEKSNPDAYRMSIQSLESTLASQDTLDTPIFWSPQYKTNVMLYYKIDPKSGGIKFKTDKLE